MPLPVPYGAGVPSSEVKLGTDLIIAKEATTAVHLPPALMQLLQRDLFAPASSLLVLRGCKLASLTVIRDLGTLDRGGVLLVPKTISK